MGTACEATVFDRFAPMVAPAPLSNTEIPSASRQSQSYRSSGWVMLIPGMTSTATIVPILVVKVLPETVPAASETHVTWYNVISDFILIGEVTMTPAMTSSLRGLDQEPHDGRSVRDAGRGDRERRAVNSRVRQVPRRAANQRTRQHDPGDGRHRGVRDDDRTGDENRSPQAPVRALLDAQPAADRGHDDVAARSQIARRGARRIEERHVTTPSGAHYRSLPPRCHPPGRRR